MNRARLLVILVAIFAIAWIAWPDRVDQGRPTTLEEPTTHGEPGALEPFPTTWPSRPTLVLRLPSAGRLSSGMASTRVMQWLASEDGAGAQLVLDQTRVAMSRILASFGLSAASFDELMDDDDLVVELAAGCLHPDALWKAPLGDSEPWACLRIRGLPESLRARLQRLLGDLETALLRDGAVRSWSKPREWGRSIHSRDPWLQLDLEFGFVGNPGCVELYVARDLEVFEHAGSEAHRSEHWQRSVLAYGIDVHQLLGSITAEMLLRSSMRDRRRVSGNASDPPERVSQTQRGMRVLSEGMGFGALGIFMCDLHPEADRWVFEMSSDVERAAWGDPLAWFSRIEPTQQARARALGQEWTVVGLDVGAVLRQWLQAVTEAASRSEGTTVDLEGDFERLFKVRLTEGILDRIGGPLWMGWTLRGDMPAQQGILLGPMGSAVFGIGVHDGPGLGKTIDRLLRSRGLHIARKTLEHEGHTYYAVPVLGVYDILYALTDDSLAIGLGKGSEAAIKRWLVASSTAGDRDRVASDDRLAEVVRASGLAPVGLASETPLTGLRLQLEDMLDRMRVSEAAGSARMVTILERLREVVRSIPDPGPSLADRGIDRIHSVYGIDGRRLVLRSVW
ncbi:MAG: hypothetical protein R3F30_11645 [Planctomycetota bacterium]